MKTTKKILLIAILFMAGVSGARAQGWYTGGTLKFWHDEYSGDNSKSTTFTLLPEVGYRWGNWAVGGSLGYTYQKTESRFLSSANVYENVDFHASALTVSPYARYFFFNSKVVSLYAQAAVAASFYFPGEGDSYTDWNCGFRPGIEFHVSEHLNLLATFGFLGYQKVNHVYANSSEDTRFVTKSFGVDLSSSSLSFGFNYTF